MRDLNTYATTCREELESIGIQPGIVDAFEINTRAKRRWGQCRKLPTGHYTININEDLLNENNSEEGLKNTIIHELLHTIAPHGHTGEWARLAHIVKVRLGYDIKRVSSAEEKGIYLSSAPLTPQTHKYCLRCAKCGYMWGYDRMSRAVKFPETFTHQKDGGHLERVF